MTLHYKKTNKMKFIWISNEVINSNSIPNGSNERSAYTTADTIASLG